MNVILCTKSLLLILFKLDPFVVHAFYLSRYHQVFPLSWFLGCFPSFFSSYDIPISHIDFHFFSPVLLIFVLFVPSFCHFLFSWLFILLYLLSHSFYPYNLICLQTGLCMSISSLLYCILFHSQILFSSHHSRLIIVSHCSNWCSDSPFTLLCIKSLESQSPSFHFLTQPLFYIPICSISKYFYSILLSSHMSFPTAILTFSFCPSGIVLSPLFWSPLNNRVYFLLFEQSKSVSLCSK